MRHITNAKPNKLYSQQKRISPIEYYLQKIKYIKNQPNTLNQQHKNDTHYNTHSNITSSFVESKTNQSVLDQRRKSYQKKRSLSMRTDIQSYSYGKSDTNKINTKTQYGNAKFHASHYNVSQLSINQDSKARLMTVSTFKVKPETRNLFGQNRFSLTRTRIATQPPENNEHLITQTQFHEEDSDVQESEQVTKSNENVKKDILFKISSYVQKLDEKGEEELNHMLVGNCKKNIRSHNDMVIFQAKIKQMISTNKEIVSMLKQQLLSPDNKRQYSQRRNKVSPKSKTILQSIVISPQKKILVKDLEINQSSLHVPQKPKAQHKRKSTILYDSLQSRHNQKIASSQQLQQQSIDGQFDYENQINHVTNQFSNEWQKSQIHKKQIYQKFRKTLFKKFPEFRERQQKLKGKNHKKEKQQEEDSFEEDNMFDSSVPIEVQTQKTMKQDKPAKILYKIQSKKQSLIQEKTQGKIKQNKKFTLLPNQKLHQQHLTKLNSSRKQINQHHQLKQTNNKLSKSLSKITLLSKRNSISKGSTKTLSVLGLQSRQEVSKFNFQNVVEFIFKRAFFYSVSKKRVIQNNTGFTQLQVIPSAEKKKPEISFINYNSKAQQRKYIRTTKLNQKKLRATGNFLVKNKFNIMEIQKEGHKGHEFLRKCLQDAIQDYLNRTKPK